MYIRYHPLFGVLLQTVNHTKNIKYTYPFYFIHLFSWDTHLCKYDHTGWPRILGSEPTQNKTHSERQKIPKFSRFLGFFDLSPAVLFFYDLSFYTKHKIIFFYINIFWDIILNCLSPNTLSVTTSFVPLNTNSQRGPASTYLPFFVTSIYYKGIYALNKTNLSLHFWVRVAILLPCMRLY